MSKDIYLEALSTADDSTHPGFAEVQQFCRQMKEYIGGPVDCELVPGDNVVSLGRELKVILSYYPLQLFQTLFRVYLPLQTDQLLIDFADGKGPQTFATTEQVQQALVGFLKVPSVSATLRSLREQSDSSRR